ncbi:MAG: hypothetical protein DLM73_15215, partial [Chthoniobacterales bacterium]
MLDKLPSLRGFQPKFYSGGPTRFYLPLLYDLVASIKPKSIVTLGFGDGQVFFTFGQAVREDRIDGQCLAIRRARAGEKESDDLAWNQGKDYGEEFYGDRVRFFASASAALAEIADGSVELLLLDDCDSGHEVLSDLDAWKKKLRPDGFVLLHGTGLEREDSPKAAFAKWIGERASAEFSDGLGLALAWQSLPDASSPYLLKQLFGPSPKIKELSGIYAIAAARIDALDRVARAEATGAALEIRQVWLDSLLADRGKVQEIMDHQARAIADLEQRMKLLVATQAEQLHHFENLSRDRAKAQLVMDTQHEQLRNWVAETDKLKSQIEKLKTQIKDQKQILSSAKKACRKGGRCFQIPGGPKTKRPLSEKIVRELRRLPRNLGISRAPEPIQPPAQAPAVVAPSQPLDRYAVWINEHEPNEAALEAQRRASKQFQARVKISLLTPVYNTPAHYLDEMFASVAAQTYDNWELCIVDGGSDRR